MTDKIRILFWGDQVVETGFGRVLHSIIKYLPDYYDVAAIGVNYNGDPHKYPYRIYPAAMRGDTYGLNRFAEVASVEKPDIIFLLNDAWVLNPMLKKIKDAYNGSVPPAIFTYVPVDAKDHDPDWYTEFDIVKQVVAYTDFGYNEILMANPNLAEKLTILPHGIDPTVFHELPDKTVAKKILYPKNRPDFYDPESFIVLNANRNQPRKRIDLTMEAFKLFSEGKPETVKLYLHMGVVDSHVHTQKLAKRLGIINRLIVTNLRAGVQTVTTERLNLIYNATDVGLNTALGEGWGLPAMEHAITGAPQIVPDHSALHELYQDCGLLIKPTLPFVLDGIMTTGYLVKPEDVADGLEKLYTDPGLRTTLSSASKQKFLSSEYNWEQITKRWVRLFEGG